jgi:hypothetical protein
MIWFIAIGAVIVRGAVAGATWDQRKGRSRDTTAWSSGYRHRRTSRPGPQGGYSRYELRPVAPAVTQAHPAGGCTRTARIRTAHAEYGHHTAQARRLPSWPG